MALAAYRHLLRAARLAFEGDTYRLIAARTAAREGFDHNRALPPSSKEVEEGIAHAEGVAKILRENIVQGRVDGADEERYKLRIHEHTERGDNETARQKGKQEKKSRLEQEGRTGKLERP